MQVTKATRDVGSGRFDAKAALKGYELLGKHLKLFADKVEQKTENSVPVQVRIIHVGS
jgi:hypothetical protein